MILKKNRSGLDSKEPLTSNEGKENYSDNLKKQNVSVLDINTFINA